MNKSIKGMLSKSINAQIAERSEPHKEIVLEAINVPAAGLALIFGVDRILDMMRTVVNVTGDSAVAVVVASTEGELSEVTQQ